VIHVRQPGRAEVVRVAAFQRAPTFDDIPGVTRRMLNDVRWCDAHGIDLAVIPECYLQGYTTNRELIARRAIAAGSPQLATFASTFAHLSVDLIVGFIERRTNGFYNAAAVIRGGKVCRRALRKRDAGSCRPML
jgi:predicted amidohydrolase